MNHIKKLYHLYAENKMYGTKSGICKITGNQSIGVEFDSWVKKTFNDFAYLKNGNIISNEALFCFDESSEIVAKQVNKDKRQRFRTYSHIIHNDKWHCLTKADKRTMVDLICKGAEIVSLNETGQKHIFFKYRDSFWQLDELYIIPDIPLFKFLHENMCELMRLGFSQKEIISGDYIAYRIKQVGILNWKSIEYKIKQYRSTGMFDFVSFMLFTDEIVKYDSKKNTQKLETKRNNANPVQLSLFDS